MDPSSSSEATTPVGLAELRGDMQQVQSLLRIFLNAPHVAAQVGAAQVAAQVGAAQVAPSHLVANLLGTPSSMATVIQSTSAGRVHSTPVTSSAGVGQISPSFCSSSGASPMPLLLSGSSSSMLSSDMSSGTVEHFNAASEAASRSMQASAAAVSLPMAAMATVTQSNRVWAEDSNLPDLRNASSAPPRSDTPAPSSELVVKSKDPPVSDAPTPSMEVSVFLFCFSFKNWEIWLVTLDFLEYLFHF